MKRSFLELTMAVASCLGLFTSLVHVTTVHATALELPAIQMHGFASIYGVATDNNDAAYKDAGRDVSFETDTMAGLQFMLPVHERVNFTLQMITKAETHYEIDAEWAYATFKLASSVDVRVGRLRAPYFSLSESLEVGYTYPWVRPPIEVYELASFAEFTGIDSMIHVPAGDGEFVLHPFYGNTSLGGLMGQDFRVDIPRIYGLNVQYTYDWLSVQLGYATSSFTFEYPGLAIFEGLMLAASGGNRDIADQFAITERKGEFSGIGFGIDKNNFKVMGEYAHRSTDSIIADSEGWYLMAGYRFGKWRPHITFSEYKTKSDFWGARNAIPFISAGPATAELQAAVGYIIQSNIVNQSSVTLGVRGDILPNTALKFEWQRISPDKGSNLLSPFVGADTFYGTSGPQDLDDVDLFSAGVDLIF